MGRARRVEGVRDRSVGIIVGGFLAGGETWTSSHGSGRSNCGIPSGSPWRWSWPPADRQRSHPGPSRRPANGGSSKAPGTRPAAATSFPSAPDRRGSIIDLQRHDAARGTGAPRRRIPRGGNRARRQRNRPCRPRRLDGRAWRPGIQRTQGQGTAARNRISGTILGGTGRYAGVTGSYEFSWQFVIEDEDGSIQGHAVGLKGRVRAGQPSTGAPRT